MKREYKRLNPPLHKGLGHAGGEINKNRKGFTLSEVLITIVIIGIVAAITIPAISRSSQKYILRNQFKKTYSTIINAMKKTDTDLGGNTLCYYLYGAGNSSGTNTDCPAFYEQLFKNLSVQKVCEGNAKAGGCIPDPYMKNYISASSSLNGFSRPNIENNNTVYNLADGTIVIRYNSNIPIVMVDINGAKGPNTLGKDIFSFLIESDGQNGMRIRNGYISSYADDPNDRWFKSISEIYKE